MNSWVCACTYMYVHVVIIVSLLLHTMAQPAELPWWLSTVIRVLPKSECCVFKSLLRQHKGDCFG